MTEQATHTPIRVLLADDQALLRAGFQMVIDSQPDMAVVGQAGTGGEAVAQTRRLSPDVVLMDVRMPDGDGIQATRTILGPESPTEAGRARTGPTAVDVAGAGTTATGAGRPKIIVLTTFDTDEYAFQALQAGASGFLLKDARPEALLDAVRTVVAGGAVVAPSTTRRLLDSMVIQGSGRPDAGTNLPDGAQPSAGLPAQERTAASGPPAHEQSAAGGLPPLTAEQRTLIERLTPRELEVLKQMATGASNTEIADSLVLSLATVKTHVGRILTKLAARDRVQAVVFAYQAGLAGPGRS